MLQVCSIDNDPPDMFLPAKQLVLHALLHSLEAFPPAIVLVPLNPGEEKHFLVNTTQSCQGFGVIGGLLEDVFEQRVELSVGSLRSELNHLNNMKFFVRDFPQVFPCRN